MILSRGRVARWGFAGTVLFGGLHAASSLYWSLGGVSMLDLVGQGAVAWRRESPLQVTAVLLPIGIVKVTAIAVPILNSRGRLGSPKLVYRASWLGAAGLVLYGGTFMTLSALTLAGRFGEVQDRSSMVGHAYVWSPLFLAWGLSLAVALWADRSPLGRPHSKALTTSRAPVP